jgi:hypothetical protein
MSGLRGASLCAVTASVAPASRVATTSGQAPARRYPLWMLAALLAAFTAARIRVLADGQVFTSYDTFSYAYRDDPFFNRGPLVSFTGDAPRLWGLPLFYAALPTDTARAAGQWALGTVAWAVLAVVVWTCLTSTLARTLAAAGILGIGLSAPLTNWDFALLAESLSISLGVLTVAGLIWWLRSGSRAGLVVLCVAGLWWTFTRPDIRVYSILIILLLLGIAWRSALRRVTALIAAGVLATGVAWCTAILPNVERAFPEYSATPQVVYDEGLLVYRLRLHVLPHPEVKALFQREFGMPACPPAEEIAASPQWRTVEFFQAYAGCPQLVAWGERNSGDVWTRFVLAEPGLYADYLYDAGTWSLTGPVYAKVPRALPALVERAVYPRSPWSLYAVVAGIAIALAAALAAGAARHRRLLFWAGTFLVAGCVVGLFAGIQFGAGEYNRFGVQEVAGLRLGMLLLVAAAIDAAAPRLARGWRARRSDR